MRCRFRNSCKMGEQDTAQVSSAAAAAAAAGKKAKLAQYPGPG
jgi:hypothetical protein